MRAGLAALCGLLAVLSGAVLLPALWVDRQVRDVETFMEFAAPLAEDAEFRERLAAATAEAAVEGLELTGGAARIVEAGVLAAAQRMTELEGFGTAWEESLRRTHAQMFGESGERRAILQISPLAALLAAQFDERLAARLEAGRLIIDLGDHRADRAVQRMQQLRTVVAVLGVVAAGSAFVALAGARHRARAVIWLAAGAAGAAALQWWLLDRRLDLVMARFETEGTRARALMEFTARAAVDAYGPWLLAAAGGAVAVAVLGGVAAVVLNPDRR